MDDGGNQIFLLEHQTHRISLSLMVGLWVQNTPSNDKRVAITLHHELKIPRFDGL